MTGELTWGDLRACLSTLFPSAALVEVDGATTVMYAMLRAAGTGASAAPTTKPAARKPRQYREKSIAESQKLKK